MRSTLLFLCLLGLVSAEAASLNPKSQPQKPASKSPARSTKTTSESTGRTTAQLVDKTRTAIVRIDGRGRDGTQEGVGTGFVIAAEGLIATSLHVIGEGRSVQVRLADGSTPEVIGIHAWDRPHDLAILRVRATGLNALPLGDSDTLPQGASVIALGHPLGASGARLITTAMYQLHRTQGRYALCTMCIGVGQGIALIIERV